MPLVGKNITVQSASISSAAKASPTALRNIFQTNVLRPPKSFEKEQSASSDK